MSAKETASKDDRIQKVADLLYEEVGCGISQDDSGETFRRLARKCLAVLEEHKVSAK